MPSKITSKKKARKDFLIRARKTCNYLVNAIEVKFMTQYLFHEDLYLLGKIHLGEGAE